MNRTGDIIILIVGMSGDLLSFSSDLYWKTFFKIRLAEELILFIKIFVGDSLY